MALIILSIVIAVFALAVGFAGRLFGRTYQAEALGQAKPWNPWLVAAILLVAEGVGVFASFYITQATLKPGQNTVVLSLIVAAANFVGTFNGLKKKLDDGLDPIEPFLFFKDGLLWPAALPALAHAIGISTTP